MTNYAEHPIHKARAPQTASNAKKPGAYELALRATNAEVAPGDQLEIQVFVTGYGYIHGAKVAFYPPPYFIDSEQSSWTYDLGKLENGTIGFGVTKDSFEAEAGAVLAISPAGLLTPQWDHASLFFDVSIPRPDDGVRQIATEKRSPKAPIEFTLKTHRKIPVGTHELYFYLTYFNGTEWRTDSKRINATVPNWFRRHEALTWIIGVLSFAATVGALIASFVR